MTCMAGPRRRRGIGEIRRAFDHKGSVQEWDGGGSTCSKPIVWLVFHGRFPIVKIAIGQN